MIVPLYASEGSATASTAARSESPWPTRRRANRYAGTAASEISTALIALAAAYASGTRSKSAQAGLISNG